MIWIVLVAGVYAAIFGFLLGHWLGHGAGWEEATDRLGEAYEFGRDEGRIDVLLAIHRDQEEAARWN